MSAMHDDDLPLIGDEFDLPVWVRYAINTTTRNAYYEVRIELNDDGRYLLVKRWGPLPDTLKGGNHKAQPYVNQHQAVAAANEAFNAKIRGEYWEADRPRPPQV